MHGFLTFVLLIAAGPAAASAYTSSSSSYYSDSGSGSSGSGQTVGSVVGGLCVWFVFGFGITLCLWYKRCCCFRTCVHGPILLVNPSLWCNRKQPAAPVNSGKHELPVTMRPDAYAAAAPTPATPFTASVLKPPTMVASYAPSHSVIPPGTAQSYASSHPSQHPPMPVHEHVNDPAMQGGAAQQYNATAGGQQATAKPMMVQLMNKIADDLQRYGRNHMPIAAPRRIAAVSQCSLQQPQQAASMQQMLSVTASMVETPDASNMIMSVFGADGSVEDSFDVNAPLSRAFDNTVFDKKLARVENAISTILPVQPDVEMNVDPFSIQFVRELGQGAFGKVYEGYWTARDGKRKHIAVKVMSVMQASDARIIQSYRTEIEIMSRIAHPHIVRCYGGGVYDDCACVLLEYMAGGSLENYIHDVYGGSRMPERDVWEVAGQVASALSALHPTIVHCDIKPANILLDENGVVKVGDFGLSKMKMHTLVTGKAGYTPAYTAPETMMGRVSEVTDIFSLGVVLWESWTGQVPWAGAANPLQIYYEMVSQKRYLDVPDDCPPMLKQLIQDCWQDAKHRPGASAIMQRVRAALTR